MPSKQKWYRQQSAADNAPAAVINLLLQLDVPATPDTVRRMVRTHHAYPSLLSLTDTLDDLHLDTMKVKIGIEQLSEVEFPCIAHLTKNSGHFVVIDSITDQSLNILDPETGWMSVGREDFRKDWSGVVVLVNRNDESGERGYAAKKREELIEKSRLPLAAAVTVMLIAASIIAGWTVFVSSPVWSLLFAIKAGGLVLSVLLMLHYFSPDSYFTQKLCPTGKKLNCKNILHSPAAKLFNLIPMADLGALYFAGGLMALITGLFSGTGSVLPLLSMINLLVLPYTFFSIYYQAAVARQWCWMCVGIQAIFWLELTVFALSGNLQLTQPDANAMLAVLWAYLLPAAAWLVLRPVVTDALKTKKLADEVLRFRQNPQVLTSFLSQQRSVDLGQQLPVEVISGDPSAPLVVTMVSYPQCPHCAITHQFLEELHEEFSDAFSYVVRFQCPIEGTSKEIAKNVIAIALAAGPDEALKALSAGYHVRGEEAYQAWKEKYAEETGIYLGQAEDIANYHTSWANAIGVKATPTFYINGRQLPNGFSIYDLRPLVKLRAQELETVMQ